VYRICAVLLHVGDEDCRLAVVEALKLEVLDANDA
jgi:hypothetical protein